MIAGTAPKKTSAANWPTAENFSTILQNPKFAFCDAELQQIEILKNSNDQPRPWAGNFACVYQGRFANGRKRAIRVFTSPSSERRDRYQMVDDYLKRVRPASVVDFTYAEKGIRSAGDGKWYPLVTMDWVAGETLYEWVRARCQEQDRKALARVADLWIGTVKDLRKAHIAHGDLQHGNVMISEAGEVKLVDYDCMCVPKLVGKQNLEIGVAAYQHPDRNPDTLLGLDLDNFSALVILVALKALAAVPQLWETHVEQTNNDKLLFQDWSRPQRPELIADLRRSPDQEVQRLSSRLVEMLNLPLSQIPALDDVLFSFTTVETKLNQSDFDGALELLTRGNKQIQEAPPAMQPRLRNAQQRVRQREALEQAVQQGDEDQMQRLYNRTLLDGYPRAQEAVDVAKLAPQVLPLLQQLRATIQAQAWRDLVHTWDAHQSLLGPRKSAQPIAAEVNAWRERNRLCDTILDLLRQPDVESAQLDAAWGQALKAGLHPDLIAKRSDIEKLVHRARAWQAVEPLLAIDDQQSDSQLVSAWNEALFAGWSRAAGPRSRWEKARQRLQVLAELRAKVETPTSLRGEQAIVQLARTLPEGYRHEFQDRVQQALQRLRVMKRLLNSLAEPASDWAIVEALGEVRRALAHGLVPATHVARVELAVKRVPLLNALKGISPQYPVQQAPQHDPKLLHVWNEELLDGCPDAQPWSASYAAARQRRQTLDQLKAAISAGDKPLIAQCSQQPCLQGYPLPRDWEGLIRFAAQDVAAAQNLLALLRGGAREGFYDVFNARVVAANTACFQPYRQLLREWLPAEVLPLDKIGLRGPLGRKAITRAPDSARSYQIRWTWPELRFSGHCILVVCRNRPAAGENPQHLAAHFRQTIDRKRYEDASGCVPVSCQDEWMRGYVVVWAVVELGFDKLFSEPLVLGRLGEESTNKKKSNYL